MSFEESDSSKKPEAKGGRSSQTHDLEALLDALAERMGSRYGPIPKQFERTFEERPFDTCSFCGRNLLDPGIPYHLVKYSHGGDLRQEIAICQYCMGDLGKLYSAKSVEALRVHYTPELLQRRREANRAIPITASASEELTQRCFRCGKHRREVAECFDNAFCFADEFNYFTYPYMQCGDCARELHSSLSEKTLELRRWFMAHHFGLPPDLHSREPAELEYVELPVWAVTVR